MQRYNRELGNQSVRRGERSSILENLLVNGRGRADTPARDSVFQSLSELALLEEPRDITSPPPQYASLASAGLETRALF